MKDELCVITGVGPGTGTALVRKFAERYRVVMIARNEQRLQALAEEVPGAIPLICDVADPTALQSALTKIAAIGAPRIVIHNAVGGGAGDVLALSPDLLQRNFQINTMALLHLIQAFAPGMVEAGVRALFWPPEIRRPIAGGPTSPASHRPRRRSAFCWSRPPACWARRACMWRMWRSMRRLMCRGHVKRCPSNRMIFSPVLPISPASAFISRTSPARPGRLMPLFVPIRKTGSALECRDGGQKKGRDFAVAAF